jgi:hypothetical protein
MHMRSPRQNSPTALFAIVVSSMLLILCAQPLLSQSCLTAEDMDAATKNALVNTAKTYYDMVARGDAASLRQASIASVASSFSSIETAIKDNQNNFTGAQATARLPFLLKAEGTAALERAEFLCGVFGPQGQTSDSAVFVLSSLPPGNYSVAILDVATPKGAYNVSFVLQQEGKDWKLGGLYLKAADINGHDGEWFASRAREFKTKAQPRNAWFYFIEARDLLAPVSFMSTLKTDKLYDESQLVKPADLPPFDLVAGGKTYKVTDLFPLPVSKDFDLVVKYQSADVSNTGQTFESNTAVMKALLAKFPEYRAAFDGVVARAVEPSGKDYGSMLPMSEIK